MTRSIYVYGVYGRGRAPVKIIEFLYSQTPFCTNVKGPKKLSVYMELRTSGFSVKEIALFEIWDRKY